MRWLVVGCRGQLGSDMVEHLEAARPDDLVVGMSRPGMDVRSETSISRVMEMVDPDFVVNCSAYTDVDSAEDRESLAMSVNALGPHLLALACSRRGARLVHVSTDYVFSGDKTSPYVESDRVGPINAYGRSKLAGEVLVSDELGDGALVVRTSWLYGSSRRNFVRSMLAADSRGGEVSVVSDQWGSPTWTRDLCVFLEMSALSGESGVCHFANSGVTTWADFAREVFRGVDADASRVVDCSAHSLGRAARRPRYSPLSTELGPSPRHWAEALSDALESMLEVKC